MEIVNFIAQLFGFSLVVVCLALLVKPANREYIFSLADQPSLLFLIGIINIVLGIALVLTYNVWDSSWKTIVTIIEWLVILRGGLILFFPDKVKMVMEKLKNNTDRASMGLVAGVLLGCILIYFGASY